MLNSTGTAPTYVLLNNNETCNGPPSGTFLEGLAPGHVKKENMKTTLWNRRIDNSVGRHDCVLVIIDVQEKLLPVIVDRQSVLSNIVRLVRVCHLTDIPIVVTEQEKLGNTEEEIKNEFSTEKVIQKIHFNCFSCEDFSERIRKTGRKTLVLAGVEAHICVTQTALHALPFHNVQIVSDAVSSRTIDNRNVALQRMRCAGATITSTEMFIYEILQKAGTDEFRAVLPLVK